MYPTGVGGAVPADNLSHLSVHCSVLARQRGDFGVLECTENWPPRVFSATVIAVGTALGRPDLSST
jgi:hypothetical protein